MAKRKSCLLTLLPVILTIFVCVSSSKPGTSGCWGRSEGRESVRLPLKRVNAIVNIQDFSASVTLIQKYKNEENVPLEISYVFPIEDSAAIHRFVCKIGGKRIVGHIEEKETASDSFRRAVNEGHGAYLLEQDRGDVLTAMIGNLPPGEEVEVSITYVTELTIEDQSRLSFNIPTTIIPPYTPSPSSPSSSSHPPSTLPDDMRWTTENSAALNVEVDIHMPSKILEVESPTHTVVIKPQNDRFVRVQLSNDKAGLDKSFILLIKRDDIHTPRLTLSSSSMENNNNNNNNRVIEENSKDIRQGNLTGDIGVSLSFSPNLTGYQDNMNTEIIFVVDRSGSMDGEPISTVKNTMQMFLRSLPKGVLFNIVGFGSTFEMLFGSGSRPYDEETFKQASDHINNMDADLGGTEILEPLQHIFSSPPAMNRSRQLFILTDGAVSNPEQVLELVSQQKNTRCFSFGIGDSSSRMLVKGIAERGHGTSTFVSSGERLQSKVMEQLHNALQPSLTNTRIEWNELSSAMMDQSPSRIPPVFHNGKLIVYGMMKRDALEKALDNNNGRVIQIDVISQEPDNTSQHRWKVDLDVDEVKKMIQIESGDGIHILYAKSRIDELESSDNAAEHKSQIISLCRRYGLTSQFTSFIAIEERASSSSQQQQQTAELRRIPLVVGRDHQHLIHSNSPQHHNYFPNNFPSTRKTSSCPYLSDDPLPFQAATESKDDFDYEEGYTGSEIILGDTHADDEDYQNSDDQAYDTVISLQMADGRWEMSSELEKHLPSSSWPTNPLSSSTKERESVWVTVMCMTHLEVKYAERKVEWKLMVSKVMEWLNKMASSESDIQNAISIAQSYWKTTIGSPV